MTLHEAEQHLSLALEAAVTWMVVDGRLAIAMQVDAGILHFERMP